MIIIQPLAAASEARRFPVSRFDPVFLAEWGDIRARASPRVQEGLCNVGNIGAGSTTPCTVVNSIAEITCG